MQRLILIILSALLLASCSYKEPVASRGSFTINGETFSFSNMRIDHVGYADVDSSLFVLRLVCYPGTMKADTLRCTGYGTRLTLFVIASRCDLFPGDMTTSLFPDSLSCVLSLSENGDTLRNIPITGATISVSSADNNFQRYQLTLSSASGESTGDYTGSHVVNRLVDQPSCGTLDFDTIHVNLAAATVYNWGHLFGADFFYHEIIAYSANARFSDSGRLYFGVQFCIGVVSSGEIRPADGTYIVSDTPRSGYALYGHKVDNANWGTYWVTFYSGSSVGKANILRGALSDLSMTDTSASFTFSFVDQLSNDVYGAYDGSILLY